MLFCSNCGHKLNETANFCPLCGTKTEKPAPVKQPEPAQVIVENTDPVTDHTVIHRTDPTFTLLDAGSYFHGHFKIEKVLHKDNEGISYEVIDERESKRRILKIYYQFYFDSVEKLFGSILRMSKIQAIKHPNIVKVFEVNQTDKPAYIVSEYIGGETLAEIRENRPEYFTEERVRIIAGTIIDVALKIKEAGLSINKLILSGVSLTENEEVKVLSTGISYDSVDEREDIYALGILFAKLLSKSPFIETIYAPFRMQENKFEYISGGSKGFNDVLAECLHRNINQRYNTVSLLAKAIKNLKPLDEDEIIQTDTSEISDLINPSTLEKPKGRIDILFWSIAVIVVILLGLMLTTNLMNSVFGNKQQPLKFTGFLGSLEDSTKALINDDLDGYRNIITDMRNVKYQKKQVNKVPSPKINPDIVIPQSPAILNPREMKTDPILTRNTLPAQRRVTMPANFIYISGDTYAFGSLRKDSRANVSISSFYISQAEVTQGEWNRLMKPVRCSFVGDNLPVDNITWFDAILYCNSRSDAEGLSRCYKMSGMGESRVVSLDIKANGYRLPTEAEWEYAARANKYTNYSGSDFPDQIAWSKDNANGRLHPVKTKSPNSFNLYDMTGNVSEWVWDWYDLNYPKVMPFINPMGPDIGRLRVIRGGDIEYPAGPNLNVTTRFKSDPSKPAKYTGFRLVRGK